MIVLTMPPWLWKLIPTNFLANQKHEKLAHEI